MTDFHVTMRRGDLDDAEVRRRLAEAYRIVLEACRRAQGQGDATIERVEDSDGALADSEWRASEDRR